MPDEGEVEKYIQAHRSVVDSISRAHQALRKSSIEVARAVLDSYISGLEAMERLDPTGAKREAYRRIHNKEPNFWEFQLFNGFLDSASSSLDDNSVEEPRLFDQLPELHAESVRADVNASAEITPTTPMTVDINGVELVGP